MEKEESNLKGISLVLISTILWAINGNIGSYLFQNKEITPEHLTMFRLIISGTILLIHQYITKTEEIFQIFNNKKDLTRLLYFALFGLLAMQYGYFVAIRYSNAATATILQGLAPFIIVIITSIIQKKLPSKTVLSALILAFLGAFFLITHGKIDELAITGLALIFGLVAAVGSVNYNLSPGSLQKKYSTVLVVAWAMLISGIGFSIVLQPWKTTFIIDLPSILGIVFVAILGTLCPFLFYLMGSKLIGAQKASILSLMEALMATVIGVLFLEQNFLKMDYIGIGLIVFGLYLLTQPERAINKKK